MSTGASIKTPWNKTYYLTHDGDPDSVEPFLRELVNEADQELGDFITTLQDEFNRLADDNGHMLNRQGAGGTSYQYTIDGDGNIETEEY